MGRRLVLCCVGDFDHHFFQKKARLPDGQVIKKSNSIRLPCEPINPKTHGEITVAVASLATKGGHSSQMLVTFRLSSSVQHYHMPQTNKHDSTNVLTDSSKASSLS